MDVYKYYHKVSVRFDSNFTIDPVKCPHCNQNTVADCTIDDCFCCRDVIVKEKCNKCGREFGIQVDFATIDRV